MGGAVSAVATRPRLGFLGVGWIGRARMKAVEREADVAAVADPAVPEALDSLEQLLAEDLDGVVIATPSALHAEQAVAALESGLAVFCQKPLGRTAEEAGRVVEAARRVDRLLAVDLSYRFTRAAQALKELDLGRIHAAELAFHNAYGPDKAWFYDRGLAGGGCVIDLGTHLVDLALWLLDWPRVDAVDARLLHRGGHEVEDYAVARLDVADGATVTVSCSWNLPAGKECVIDASFYGSAGGARLRNVDGSFYDLRAERFDGTRTEALVEPPDDWGGRAIRDWARRLGTGARFDPEIEHVVEVARTIDRIYGSDGCAY
jgi:predicted dehydrogenase